MKKILILASIVALVGCQLQLDVQPQAQQVQVPQIQTVNAKDYGIVKTCIDGVWYLMSSTGSITPQINRLYDKLGPVKCKE